MRTFKKIRRLIESDPLSEEARVLAALVTALEGDTAFSVKDLYSLDEKHFDMAIQLLSDWRLDRYYLGKAKVFDMALQAKEVQAMQPQDG
jgi:hypothetical protein